MIMYANNRKMNMNSLIILWYCVVAQCVMAAPATTLAFDIKTIQPGEERQSSARILSDIEYEIFKLCGPFLFEATLENIESTDNKVHIMYSPSNLGSEEKYDIDSNKYDSDNVKENDREILGIAFTRDVQKITGVDGVIVDLICARKGYGRPLLNFAEEQKQFSILCALPSKVGFYEHMGYSVFERVDFRILGKSNRSDCKYMKKIIHFEADTNTNTHQHHNSHPPPSKQSQTSSDINIATTTLKHNNKKK
eukprot:Pgem_evm1s6651